MKPMKRMAALFTALLLCLLMVLPAGTVQADSVIAEDVHVPCRNFSLPMDEGGTFTKADLQGQITAMVFVRADCGNSLATLQVAAQSEWIKQEGLSVVAVNIESAADGDWNDFLASVGSDDILYGTRDGNSTLVWDLLRDVGFADSSVFLPVTVFIDATGTIRYVLAGQLTEEDWLTYLYYTGADVALPSAPLKLQVTGMFDYDMAYEVLDIINETRAEVGLPALYMDEVMLEYAMQRAVECAVYYGHTRPTGQSCFSIVEYESYYNAENVAAGQRTAAEVMEDFNNSPGHYKNIISATATNVGVGCFYQNGRVYWAQFFGNRVSDPVSESGKKVCTATVQAREDYLDLTLRVEQTELDEIGQTAEITVWGDNVTDPQQGIWYDVNPASFAWESSDPSVVTVKDGVVTAVGSGTATVRMRLEEGMLTKDFTVTAEAPAGLPGDADMSGEVDAADLTAVARLVAGIAALPSGQGQVNADVDGQPGVTASDLTVLARFVAGIGNL